ncbi:MAG: hypothetical protein ACK56I_03210, partial [bacterium]
MAYTRAALRVAEPPAEAGCSLNSFSVDGLSVRLGRHDIAVAAASSSDSYAASHHVGKRPHRGDLAIACEAGRRNELRVSPAAARH